MVESLGILNSTPRTGATKRRGLLGGNDLARCAAWIAGLNRCRSRSRGVACDHDHWPQTRSSLMRKAGFVFVVLLLAVLGSAMAQEIPKLPPEDNPHAKA